MQSEFTPVITVPAQKDKRFGWRLWVLVSGIVALIFGVYLVLLVGLGGRQYESHAEIEFLAERDSGAAAVSSEELVKVQMGVLFNQQTALMVVDMLQLAERWRMGKDRFAAVEQLMGLTRVESRPGSALVRVIVRSTDADRAAEMAEGWIKAYEQRNLQYFQQRGQQEMYSLQAVADQLEKKIEEKRVATLALTKKYGVPQTESLSADSNGLPGLVREESGKLKMEISLLTTQLNALKAIRENSAQSGHLLGELRAIFPEDRMLADAPSEGFLRNYASEKEFEITQRRIHAGRLMDNYEALRTEELSEAVSQQARSQEIEIVRQEWRQEERNLAALRDRIHQQKLELEMGPPPLVRRHGIAYPNLTPLLPEALLRDFWTGIILIIVGILLLVFTIRIWPKNPPGSSSGLRKTRAKADEETGMPTGAAALES